MSSSEEINASLNERLERCMHRVQAATVPVYVHSTPVPRHVGSGVLIRIGDRHFMFTAGHVADYRAKGDLYLGGSSYPIQLSGSVTHTKSFKEGRRDDDLDVAIIGLSDEVVRHLRPHEFLDPHELDVGDVPRYDDYFLVAGFPCTRQEFVHQSATIEAEIYPFVAVSKSEEAYAAASVPSRHHILLGFNKKEMWRRDLGKVTAPDLYGMSGGGIWWLENYTSAGFHGPKLHALAVEWHADSRKQVLGTRLLVPLSYIWNNFPELRASLP